MVSLLALLIIVSFAVIWINFFRISSVKNQLQRLEAQLLNLKNGQSAAPPPKTKSADKAPGPWTPTVQAPLPEECKEDPAEEIEYDIDPMPVYSDAPAGKTVIQKPRFTFEQNFAERLPVWIGAVSLILGIFYLVKYSIDAGWLTSTVRVMLGGLSGMAMIGAGQWVVRRPKFANARRIAQGLVGAGLVILYVSLYAAVSLYGLIPSLAGFIGMALVTGAAVIMSVRHGQPIAIFGIVGGLLTPALVGAPEPNTPLLFTYLFMLTSFLLALFIHRGWWILAIMALGGLFAWSAFWMSFFFIAADAFIIILAATAGAGVALALTAKYRPPDDPKTGPKTKSHWLNLFAIAGASLIVFSLALHVSLSLFDWSMLGLLSLGLIALVYFQPQIYQIPLYVKLALVLVLYVMSIADMALLEAGLLTLGLAVLYIGLPFMLMRKTEDPRCYAIVQVAAAIGLYLMAFLQIDMPAGFINANGWGIAGMILAALSAGQAGEIFNHYHSDGIIRKRLIALYCLSSTAFISMALAIELPEAYLPMALAGQITATVWVYRKTDIQMLSHIIMGLCALFAVLYYDQITLFQHLFFDLINLRIPPHLILETPLLKLGVPLALMAGATWLIVRKPDPDLKEHNLRHLLGALTLALFLALGYYLIRILLEDGFQTTPAEFLTRACVTLFIVLTGIGLRHLSRLPGYRFFDFWVAPLIHLAVLRIWFFDFFLHNPIWGGQQVGSWPILNGITLVYGGATALIGYVMYSGLIQKFPAEIRNLYKISGIAALLLFTSFTVRHLFHGSQLFPGAASAVEIYSYSAIWLLTGIIILSFGIWRQSQAARMGSLIFIGAAILKVFLYDAAALEGLYRVFSFLGLGLCLIGLSYFYTRFVFNNDDKAGASNG